MALGINHANKKGGMLDMFGFGAGTKQKGNLVSLSSNEISGANPMRDSPTHLARNPSLEASRRLTPTNTPGLNTNQKIDRHEDFSMTDSFDKHQTRSANPSPFQKVPKGTLQLNQPVTPTSSSSSSIVQSNGDKVKEKLLSNMKNDNKKINDFEILIERLQKKDATLVEITMNNSNIISQKDENFQMLADCLKNNSYIISIELANVMMKDRHCIFLAKSWETMPNLVKLNVETNSLTGTGIEAIACIAERHPSLKEIRVSNQRMAVGVEAERALANCLSQNTIITKLSHNFREKFVQVYADKYIQRNMDLQRQLRMTPAKNTELKGSSTSAADITPYPFPKRDIFVFAQEVMYPPSPSPTNQNAASISSSSDAASSSSEVASISGANNNKKSFFPDSSPLNAPTTTIPTKTTSVAPATSKPTPSSHITAMSASINTTTKVISPLRANLNNNSTDAADSANRVIISPRPTTTSDKYNSSNKNTTTAIANTASPRSASTPRGGHTISSSNNYNTSCNGSSKKMPLRSVTPSPQQERVHQERTSFFARMTASKGKLDTTAADEQNKTNDNNSNNNYIHRKLGNRQSSVGSIDMNRDSLSTSNTKSATSMFSLFSKGSKSPSTTNTDTAVSLTDSKEKDAGKSSSSSTSVYEPVTPKYSQAVKPITMTPAVITPSAMMKATEASSSSPSRVATLASTLAIPQCKEASQSFNGVKNAFEILIDRLQAHDATLTEVIMNNTNVISNKDENFKLLSDCLRNNKNIINIELNNVQMKDSHCIYFADVWKSMLNLVKLNVETNSLTGMGIEAIAAMAEKHPSLKEIRVSNQRMAVGVEAERALANCLSQNTNIIKLSHAFRERFVQTYVDKYIQRNLDLQRQQRVGAGGSKQNVLTSGANPQQHEPYPFPSRQQAEAAAAALAANTAPTPLNDHNSSASNVLNSELKKLKSINNSTHTNTTAASSSVSDNDDDDLSNATPSSSNISPVKAMMATMEKNNAKTTASMNSMNAVLKKTPIKWTAAAVEPLSTSPLSLSLPLSPTKEHQMTNVGVLSPKTSPRGVVTTPRTKSLAELNINVSERMSLYEKNNSSSLSPRLFASPTSSVEGDHVQVFSPVQHAPEIASTLAFVSVVPAAVNIKSSGHGVGDDNINDDEDQISQVSLTPPKNDSNNISIYDSENSGSSSITNSVNNSGVGGGEVILMMSRDSSPVKGSSPVDRAHETRKSIHTSKMGANFFIKQPTTGIKRNSIVRNSSSSSSSSDKNRQSETSAAATRSLRSTPSVEVVHTNTASAAVDYLESPNTGRINGNNSNKSGNSSGSDKAGGGELVGRAKKPNSLRVVSSKNGANLRLTPTRENSIVRKGVAALFPSVDMDSSD